MLSVNRPFYYQVKYVLTNQEASKFMHKLMFFLRRFLTRFLTPNFNRNHVRTNLLCYLQVVPCHLRLRARFHIRFKRHARGVGQVRHFSIKSCVLKTRAKPVTKTFRFRPISLEKQISLISCVLQDSYVLI